MQEVILIGADGKGMMLGNEPPQDSYFYQKNKDGLYKTIGMNFDGYWDKDLYNYYDKAMNMITGVDAWNFRTDKELDFKKDHPNQIGVAYHTVMTSRDAGNAHWGGYMANRYGGLGYRFMKWATDTYAGGKEHPRSYAMQKWGWDNKLNWGWKKK